MSTSLFKTVSQWFRRLFHAAPASTPVQDVQPSGRKRRRRKKPAEAAAPAERQPSPAAPQPVPSHDSEHSIRCGSPSKKQLGSWAPPPAPSEREEGAVYFQDFPLAPAILRAALEDLNFVKCTPIQSKALPAALDGGDIAGKAQTGTGKTAVFLMATIQRFLEHSGERRPNQPFALVLAPTRELALQIARDAENFSIYTPLRCVAVFGGMDYERQQRLLQAGADLVVATPGRLIDFIQKRVIDTSRLRVLVIDEADRMLDMGFIPDVKRIVYHLPPREARQTMLFSATLSPGILSLASAWMRPSPAVIEIEPEQVVAAGINETVYACTTREKLAIMLWVLHHEDCRRVLIFRNRRHDVENLAEQLRSYGIACETLSGDVTQNRRLKILEDFRAGTVKVVVATDVAGRGIQVDDVTHVFNYDFPYEAEDYVHRVGRTARAGHVGRAISFADEDCAFVIPDIEEYIGRALPITQPEDGMLVLPPRDPSYRPRPREDADGSSWRNRSGRRSSSTAAHRTRPH